MQKGALPLLEISVFLDFVLVLFLFRIILFSLLLFLLNLYPFFIIVVLILGHGSLLRALWVHFGTPLKIAQNYEKVLFYSGGSYISKQMYRFM